MLTVKDHSVLHRTSITAADSGNVPSAWADAPSSFGGMSDRQILRVYVVENSGTIATLGLTVLVVDGSNTHVATEFVVSSPFTETINFSGFAGEISVYVRISTLTGTSPNISLRLSGVNQN